ncbi:hypothetical protein HMPREF9466_00329 [Fusobacterium necrophorum subsp. funduliforme 1_1_36S]|nr:hypothetical protein HMPREF9466_00329 [Fusobacterium necrophorum subsp. funduliforme 1_1_36S]
MELLYEMLIQNGKILFFIMASYGNKYICMENRAWEI